MHHNRTSHCVSLALLALTISYEGLRAQPPDSCLIPYPATLNPFNVMLDTCDSGPPPERRMYTKEGFYLFFDEYVIDLPAAPADSLILVDWRVIEARYVQLRQAFQAIEDQFGPMLLRKRYPDDVSPEHLTSRTYALTFLRYVHVGEAIEALNAMVGIEVAFVGQPSDPGFVPLAHSPTSLPLIAYPNPTRNHLYLTGGAAGEKEIAVYLPNGTECLRLDVAPFLPNDPQRVELPDLAIGYYFIRLGSSITPILIQH